jgi:hypothetical protein
MRRDPGELRRIITRLAGAHAGLFTAAQALGAGYSYPAQHSHVQQGDWIRVDRGIFRLADWPADGRPDLVRWTLWSEGAAIISHDSALAVHELGDVVPARTHVTLPPGVRRRSGSLAIHHAAIPDADVEDHGGYRVTRPLRSLVDCAADHLEVDLLAGAIDDALRRHLVATDELLAAAVARPGAEASLRLALGQLGA